MNASRAYESDASIFDLGKQLAEKTVDRSACESRAAYPDAGPAPLAPAGVSGDAGAFAQALDALGAAAGRRRRCGRRLCAGARRCNPPSTAARAPTSRSRRHGDGTAQRQARSRPQHASMNASVRRRSSSWNAFRRRFDLRSPDPPSRSCRVRVRYGARALARCRSSRPRSGEQSRKSRSGWQSGTWRLRRRPTRRRGRLAPQRPAVAAVAGRRAATTTLTAGGGRSPTSAC